MNEITRPTLADTAQQVILGEDARASASALWAAMGALASLSPPIVAAGAAFLPMASAISSARDAFWFRKAVRFLSELDALEGYQRKNLLHKLTAKMSDEQIGEVIFHYVDRSDGNRKCALMGRLFCSLGKGEINVAEFQSVLHALSELPTFVVEGLQRFNRDPKRESESGKLEGDYQSAHELLLISAGCGEQVLGEFAGGATMVLRGRILDIIFALKEGQPVLSS